MKLTLSTILCTAVVLCTAVWSVNANLVADSGFEASADGLGPHPFSASWGTNDPAHSGAGGDGAFAHSGTNYAFFGTPSPLQGLLSQQPLAGLVIGQSYNISFWLANDITAGLPSGNSFKVAFDGQLVFSLDNQAAFAYTQFTISNLVYTGNDDSLAFGFQHNNDFWRLDDVSVEAAGVPETLSTIWLALPAFGALGLLQFSRARARRSLSRS